MEAAHIRDLVAGKRQTHFGWPTTRQVEGRLAHIYHCNPLILVFSYIMQGMFPALSPLGEYSIGPLRSLNGT